MNKHILNLHRLCEKMAVRYGEDDALVMEFRQEIAAHEAKKSKEAASANLRRRKGDVGRTAQAAH